MAQAVEGERTGSMGRARGVEGRAEAVGRRSRPGRRQGRARLRAPRPRPLRRAPAPGRAGALAVLGLALLAGVASAQEIPLPGAAVESTEPQRTPLQELEAQVARARTVADEWAAKAKEFEEARLGAPERLREIERDITSLEAPSKTPVPVDASVDDLEVEVLGAEQDLALARKELATLQAEAGRRSERRRKIPELLADARQRLEALGEASPAGPDETPALLDARERLLEARTASLSNEIRAYEQELASYDARGRLLDKRLERARMRIAFQEQRFAALQDALTAAREGEAQRAAQRALDSLERAESLTPDVRDVVRQLATTNAELAQQRTGEGSLLRRIDDLARKIVHAEEGVTTLESEYERLSARLESAGLTDSVGLLLRKTRAEVPDTGMFRRFIRLRQEEIGHVQARQTELREELASLDDPKAMVERTLARLGPDTTPQDRARLEGLLRDLLDTKRRVLQALLDDYETYFQKLVDLDSRQQELIQRSEKLLRFIDERILWVPSSDVVRPRIVGEAMGALAWLASPVFVGQLLRALVAVLADAPIVVLCALLFFGLAVPLRARVRAQIGTIGARVREPTCTDVAPTWEALGLSLALAAWGPALVAFVGWRLDISPDATQYVRCVAYGLVSMAAAWAGLEMVRQLLRRDGLAEAHFGWPADAVRRLRRQVAGLAGVLLPAVLLVQVFEMRGEDPWKESVGRIAFVAAMIASAVFGHLALREGGALRRILHAVFGDALRAWSSRLLHGAAIAVPVFLAAAAARGYYWTSLQLATSYHLTLVFLFLLLVLAQLFERWSLLASRRLALRHFEEQREAREEAERRTAADATGEMPDLPRPEIDLAAVTAQTGRLARNTTLVVLALGLWVIWADLVPAVGILDDVELWSSSETVQVERTDAEGVRHFESEQRVVPVTLADGMLAVIFGFMTLVFVRNLPGLLEISLFRRIGIATGERYAYATLAKYAITLAGVTFAFRAVGVGWRNIQWLVAAVGLGLGFGLQEIFANFVSGLIILFERPIRVGDTVTVGDVSGRVSRIRIRATWITGFDRKELVVPNKEFVTNRLVNWSLSDAVLRVDVPVGIAYGSDTEKAMRVLLAVARRTPHVLTDPPPVVFFLGFGDSALQFELRVYSPDVEHRLTIQHELHLAVDRAFREAGIEIAFPQRDVHVRSVVERGAGNRGG